MNVSLTPELEQLVAGKVESGMYTSASEVVREALRLLKERDELRQARLEELRPEIAVGLKQAERGQTRPFDPEDLNRRVRTRLSKGGTAATSYGSDLG
jgi:antitoxin ParD1/3/4